MSNYHFNGRPIHLRDYSDYQLAGSIAYELHCLHSVLGFVWLTAIEEVEGESTGEVTRRLVPLEAFYQSDGHGPAPGPFRHLDRLRELLTELLRRPISSKSHWNLPLRAEAALQAASRLKQAFTEDYGSDPHREGCELFLDSDEQISNSLIILMQDTCPLADAAGRHLTLTLESLRNLLPPDMQLAYDGVRELATRDGLGSATLQSPQQQLFEQLEETIGPAAQHLRTARREELPLHQRQGLWEYMRRLVPVILPEEDENEDANPGDTGWNDSSPVTGPYQSNGYLELRLDDANRTVSRRGHQVKLSKLGWRLLKRLVRARGGKCDHRVLYECWCDETPEKGTVRAQIRRLRTVIKPLGLVIDNSREEGWGLREE